MAAIRFPLGSSRYRYYGRARHVQPGRSRIGSLRKKPKALYYAVFAALALLYALVAALKD